MAGLPLIAHTIGQALESETITRVVVSTDDTEIADIARRFGAEVPFLRPAEHAEDLSPDIDVLRHALSWLADHDGYAPELVVHLRPTGPVRRVVIIDEAVRMMIGNPTADSLRSVSQAGQTPYKMWRIGQEGYLEPLLEVEGLPECQSMPRQMLPQVMWQNGYVDVIRPTTILVQESMCGRRTLPFVVDEPVYEIDYPESIPLVEEALRRLKDRARSPQEHIDRPIRHSV